MVFGDEVGRGSSPVRGGKRRVGPGGRGGGDRCAFKVAPELATEAATATPTEARSRSCPARCSWGADPGCIGEAEATMQWWSEFFRPILRLGGACSNAGEGLVKVRSGDSGAPFFNIDNVEADFDGDGGKRGTQGLFHDRGVR